METAALTPRSRRGKRGRWDRETFLQALAEDANVSRACGAAGIARSTAYLECARDEAFRARWDEAIEDAGDNLEREAFRRAVEGVEKPVFQGGVEVGRVREYSDSLLTLLLKAAKPEKYRERKDVTSAGENVQVVLYLPDNERGDAPSDGAGGVIRSNNGRF